MTADFSALIRQQAFINGAWVDADSKKTFAVVNPATGAEIARVPDMGAAETDKAIAAAAQAWPGWRAMLAKERSALLKKWFALITENQEALARLLTAEQGKPLKEARGEIESGAAYIEWMAAEACRVYGETLPSVKAGTRSLVVKEPVGVVGAVTPWNFPHSMITRKVAPALAAGCTVVLKPAEDTPLSALALAVLAEKAGFPKGVLNIVTGAKDSAAAIGKALTESKDVRKFSFTGSTAVGKTLMAQCASTVKRVSLELGGNAPFIIFESADLDKAVELAVASKFRNAGQTCVCANRIYVQDSIYEAFAEKLAARVRQMKIGAGDQHGVEIGPLINQKGLEKVERHVADALSKGGKLVCGGKIAAAGNLFYEPTVITEANNNMALQEEETFGPVAALFRFKTEAEAIREANNTRHGLAAYFCTSDMAQSFRVADALEYGMIGINEQAVANEATPFGGYKESGIGRENGRYGIEEFIEVKYILVGGLRQQEQ